MSNARRNIIRARPPDPINAPQAAKRRQRLQEKLSKAEETLARWWKRLQRAAKVIDKQQKQIARLQRQLQSPS